MAVKRVTLSACERLAESRSKAAMSTLSESTIFFWRALSASSPVRIRASAAARAGISCRILREST